jgi:hypothetical protein
MLFTAGESISNRAEPDEPEIWRDALGVDVPIPTLPPLRITLPVVVSIALKSVEAVRVGAINKPLIVPRV